MNDVHIGCFGSAERCMFCWPENCYCWRSTGNRR